jgi:molybdopterin-containing oxidoreductase family membrane subunit
VGLYGLYSRIAFGHERANYGSYVPWGLWVAAYLYLVGLSAGAFLFSTLVYVFNIRRVSGEGTVAAPAVGMADGAAFERERLEQVGKLALFTALVTLVGAMICIWMDLGHPERAWKLIFQTSFRSVMGWMIWFYSAYFILLLAELWLAMRGDLVARSGKSRLARFLTFGRRDVSPTALAADRRLLRILGSVGVVLAIAFHGSVGAIFGVVAARPYWNSALTPIIFLAGALLSGGALLTFITGIWGPEPGSASHRNLMSFLGQIVLGLLALDVLLEWAEISISLWSGSPAESASLKLVLFGPYWWVFWIVHIGFGVIVPAILLIFLRRKIWAVALAGALITVTFLSVRLNIVVPGLAIPELPGLEAAFHGPGLTTLYVPSLSEWLLFVWAIGLAALIFLIGRRVLPIIHTER